MASTTNGIATILEACTIGGVTPPADIYNRCVLLSELGTFGCVLIDEPSVEYAANQAVKWSDITQLAVIVSFNMNGHGAQVSDIQTTPGARISEPAKPTASGYNFLGWYKDDGTFVEPWVFTNDTVPLGGITLHAYWVVGTYTLTVTSYPNSNYGTATGSGAYSSGATATMTATPKPGCKFVQWSDASTTNPKTVTMNQNRSYSANFIMEPTDDIRIVDNELKLYDYFEWQSLATKPTPIGVAIVDNAEGHDEWLVWYKTYIGDGTVTGVKEYIPGGDGAYTMYKPGNGQVLAAKMMNTPDEAKGNYYDLLYPHSGRVLSDTWKALNPSAACAQASTLSDGGLYWYVFNVYEANQLYAKILDKTVDGNTVHGIDSYFVAAGLGKVIRHHVRGGSNTHNHSTVDADSGGVVYRMAMESDPSGDPNSRPANSIGFWTGGNYGGGSDRNWIRPVARFVTNGKVKATFNRNGGSGVAPDEITKFYNDCILLPDRGTLSSNFRGWDTNPSATTPTYQPGDPVFLTADTTFYAIY